MKMCLDHWNDLRDEIDARELTEYVAPDGAECARRLLTGEFEPLMEAHNLIMMSVGNALAEGVATLPAGEVCPVCFGNEQHDATCEDPDCPIEQGTGHGYADFMLPWVADKMRRKLDAIIARSN